MHKLLSVLFLGFLALDADALERIKVSTSLGDLVGRVNQHNVATFLGVPYAHAPVVERRFQLPESPFEWKGSRDAFIYAPACHQETVSESFELMRQGQQESEDCLYLDIYVDGDKIDPNAKLPVVVFIHGGGFVVGSSATYDYSQFVKGRGVVAVAIQYRLGLFGFAKSPDDEKIPGNLGLHDQVAAIKWVKKHIGSFGGNPNSITLQGESAGSISIAFHLFSPLMKDTFQRAIMESGATRTGLLMDEEKLQETMKELIEFVHCKPEEAKDNDSYECLKHVNVMSLKQFIANAKAKKVSFAPSIDSRYFGGKNPVELEKKGEFTTKLDAALIGHNGNEGGMFIGLTAPQIFPVSKKPLLRNIWKWQLKLVVPFVPKQFQSLMSYLIEQTYEDRWVLRSTELANKLGKSLGDVIFACPNEDLSIAILKNNPKTKLFYYHYLVRPVINPKKVWPYIREALHAEELQFVFGKPFYNPSDYTGSELLLSASMMDDWAEFVKTGQVKNKKWLQTKNEEGNINFSHILYANSTHIESKLGFPPSICKILPDNLRPGN